MYYYPHQVTLRVPYPGANGPREHVSCCRSAELLLIIADPRRDGRLRERKLVFYGASTAEVISARNRMRKKITLYTYTVITLWFKVMLRTKQAESA